MLDARATPVAAVLRQLSDSLQGSRLHAELTSAFNVLRGFPARRIQPPCSPQ